MTQTLSQGLLQTSDNRQHRLNQLVSMQAPQWPQASELLVLKTGQTHRNLTLLRLQSELATRYVELRAWLPSDQPQVALRRRLADWELFPVLRWPSVNRSPNLELLPLKKSQLRSEVNIRTTIIKI